ncbi:MAG TPA: GIY-YIG nuclease family protein [Anaeromyxobacteraceae bacterium]
MLRCCDGSLYTGATSDLARRLDRHAAGVGARYTRSRLPVILVYEERARDRGAALRREAFLKRLTRAQKVALVDGAGERRAGAVTPGHRRPARRRRRGPAPAAAR